MALALVRTSMHVHIHHTCTCTHTCVCKGAQTSYTCLRGAVAPSCARQVTQFQQLLTLQRRTQAAADTLSAAAAAAAAHPQSRPAPPCSPPQLLPLSSPTLPQQLHTNPHRSSPYRPAARQLQSPLLHGLVPEHAGPHGFLTTTTPVASTYSPLSDSPAPQHSQHMQNLQGLLLASPGVCAVTDLALMGMGMGSLQDKVRACKFARVGCWWAAHSALHCVKRLCAIFICTCSINASQIDRFFHVCKIFYHPNHLLMSVVHTISKFWQPFMPFQSPGSRSPQSLGFFCRWML